MTGDCTYIVEVKQGRRWDARHKYSTLRPATLAMHWLAGSCKTGTKMRIRRTGRGREVVGHEYTVVREPSLRRATDDVGWRTP